MREYKFRAWYRDYDYSNGSPPVMKPKMLEVLDIDFEAKQVSVPYKVHKTTSVDMEDIPPLMQYINRQDKNGNGIYEGDILVLPMSAKNRLGPYYYEVCWSDHNCGFTLFMDGYDHGWNWIEDMSIKGNIYENPELVGGAR